MAQHDYINKKPKNRKNTKKEPAKKPFPYLLVIVAALLVGGFAYGLWFIKNNADPELVEKQTNACMCVCALLKTKTEVMAPWGLTLISLLLMSVQTRAREDAYVKVGKFL